MDHQGRYAFFAEQYATYLPRVLNYVRLRVDDEALAQDLTALTFERALANIGSLRDEKAVGSWLFRIAHNVVAAHYRRRRREVPLEWVENRPALDLPAEAEVERSEELQAMRAVLATLPEREQEIIRLRFVGGLTNRAVARTMGLRPGNVAVILYRALRKMRSKLEQETERADET